MRQPITKPITPFIEFVNSVFTELYHWETEYSYYNMLEPDYWKNTLVPLAINLYELAQTDDAVYWWLLQQMSQVDVCKDCKEDFRKYEVFDVLSKLKREHQKIILDKCVPDHVEELQKALDDDAFDAFKSMLPMIYIDETIYKIGRVLKRVMDVHEIYAKTMSFSKGDSLAILFVLIRRYYVYFANAYDNNHRSCDGMAKNVFLALYQTQYREDNNDFCKVIYKIGELWLRSLILVCFIWDKVPKVMIDILQNQNVDKYNKLEFGLKKTCDYEEQTKEFIKENGGWLEIENYSFIFEDVLKKKREKHTPPFSCKSRNIMGDITRRRSVRIFHNDEEHHYRDNCIPYLESKNAIPMEELKALAASEDVQNTQGVSGKPRESTLSIPGQIKLYKDDNCDGEYETISLSFEKKTPFLEELAVLLSVNNYFIQDAQEKFIHAFDGTTVSSESHSKIDWRKSAASLFALCYVLFDEEITGKWPIIANLFVAKGKSIDTSNASKFKTGTNRRKMQRYVKEALEEIGVA